MDAVELAPARYAKVLADLSRINALTLAARPTLGFLERVRARGIGARPWRILDVGFGAGDMLARIARWGDKRGVALDLVGVDLNPNSAPVAEVRLDGRVRLVTGDYRDLAGEGWDIVMSSLVAHHMTPIQRSEFLRFMEREVARGWLVNDLHRQRLPFAGYPLLATLAWVDPIVRRDGQLSVGRSFRRSEWTAMLVEALPDAAGDCRIFRSFPYRLCVERIR
ncbi:MULTISPECIES: methyltransferase domain-containing protein [unclassified Sphingopyxis]|uniref:methyltransferase domain-containing protein n=1 Tax=unclassified Sphingopyxis TaxID=2614943 RepID=UPI000736A9B0|nr:MULTISPECIES: methyltransferase domain-containing protein [unclassified Sphingopyxis]KTE37671.1 methyltransferase type 12 [Sphingopyxis sp. HIX]KTE76253.1 methyltransferase type 12 [Sphingopyxis sp. HXXIV]